MAKIEKIKMEIQSSLFINEFIYAFILKLGLMGSCPVILYSIAAKARGSLWSENWQEKLKKSKKENIIISN